MLQVGRLWSVPFSDDTDFLTINLSILFFLMTLSLRRKSEWKNGIPDGFLAISPGRPVGQLAKQAE